MNQSLSEVIINQSNSHINFDSQIEPLYLLVMAIHFLKVLDEKDFWKQSTFDFSYIRGPLMLVKSLPPSTTLENKRNSCENIYVDFGD